MWPLVHDENTDIGTALLLYWSLEGPYLIEENCSYNHDVWQMNQILKERICTAFYKHSNIQYDPVEDKQLSRVQVAKLLKAGVDEILLTKVSGVNR